jgi:hypothetical protein
LPAQRKLKVVKERIDEIAALKAGFFNDQQTIDYIRQMFRDAGRFAKCETLAQYLNALEGMHAKAMSNPWHAASAARAGAVLQNDEGGPRRIAATSSRQTNAPTAEARKPSI